VVAVHIVVGSLAIALNAVAAFWGAYCWRVRRASLVFWRALRGGQVLVIIEAILGGVWILEGRKVTELHVIYGLVPIFVAFMAEQLRISAAQMVLDKRGFLTSADVGQMPESDQKAIVLAVVRREIGVMTLSALVTLVLIVRAAMSY
jgi:hypothetical protein